jgi:hypothetical protein
VGVRLFASGSFFVFVACAAFAQPLAVTHVEGDVYVAGQLVAAGATLANGSVLRTEAGRAAVQLPNGTLFLGENSSVRVSGDSRLDMIGGTAVVTTSGDGGVVVCQDTVALSAAGIFRFDLAPILGSQHAENNCRIRVWQGIATVRLATLSTTLTSGKTMRLNHRCGDMVPTHTFDSGDRDAFDRWSRQRADLGDQRQ